MSFDDIVLEYTAWEEFRLADSWASTMADAFDINDAFIDIEEALNETPGMSGIGYKSKFDDISKLNDNLKNLQLYVDYLPEDIRSLIDKPLYEEFNERATEAISRIKLEEITTKNTIGLMTEIGIQESSTTQSVELEYLNLGDFTGANIGDTLTIDYVTSTQVNCVDSFANMYKAQYENLVKLEYLDSSMTLESYLDSLMNRGEFNNEMDKPILETVSSILDVTVIKPIIEAFTGTDLITKEDLSESEQAWGVVGAIVTVGFIALAIPTGGASIGAKTTIKTIGKEMLVDAGATGASVIAASTGIPGLALLSSMATGTSISKGIDGSFALKVGDDIIPLTASQADELAAATGKPIINAINPSQIDEVVGIADDVVPSSKINEILEAGDSVTAEDIVFSDKFNMPAYSTQVAERGWTTQTMTDTINNPVKTATSINKYTGNPVTAYYIDDIHYVAVDDVSGKVIQIADMNDSYWKFDVSK